jgi:hypothetical protein
VRTAWDLGRPSNISDDADPPAPLKFERRQVDRWHMHGSATAFRLAGPEFGRMYDLHLQDYSHDGLGATCSDPIEPGSLISIGFQRPGYLARRGTVVRCLPTGDGYRLAVRFEQRMAA